MAFRYLDSLSGQTWMMLGGAGVVTSSCGLGYKVWERRAKTQLLSERDCVATVEVSRNACTVLNGFDVVIRNYFYKQPPVAVPWSTQLRNMLPIWLRSDTETGNLMSSSVVTPAEKLMERNRLAATRIEQRSPMDGPAAAAATRQSSAGDRLPQGPSQETRNRAMESVWPAGTSRYCGMTIEPSTTSPTEHPDEGANRRVERGALRALIDRSTQQTLVKCRSNVAVGDDAQNQRCESDPSFLSAPYLRTMLGAFGLLPFPLPALRVCFLGVGGGALPMFLQQHFASKILHMDLVDVEPQVLRSAALHMGLRQLVQSAPLACHAKDAHSFLVDKDDPIAYAVGTTPSPASPTMPYDMIFVDVFVGSETPEHLQSEAFLHAVRNALSTVGVATFNMPSSNKSFVKQCEHVFGKENMFVAPCRHSANNVLFAMKRKSNEGLTPRHVLKRCRELSKAYHIPYDLPAHFPLWWSVA